MGHFLQVLTHTVHMVPHVRHIRSWCNVGVVMHDRVAKPVANDMVIRMAMHFCEYTDGCKQACMQVQTQIQTHPRVCATNGIARTSHNIMLLRRRSDA